MLQLIEDSAAVVLVMVIFCDLLILILALKFSICSDAALDKVKCTDLLTVIPR